MNCDSTARYLSNGNSEILKPEIDCEGIKKSEQQTMKANSFETRKQKSFSCPLMDKDCPSTDRKIASIL
jgi:ABC-type xylose transport system substrate-binding protein